MTIDERAESYGADLCAYCRECEGEKSCQHKIDAMHGYKDGFKEGLKQKVNITTISDCPIKDDWHDLRKDPNDLPKEVGRYIVCYLDTACERHTFELSFVDYLEDEHWIDENGHDIEVYDEGVIAWCEIPTFNKE